MLKFVGIAAIDFTVKAHFGGILAATAPAGVLTCTESQRSKE